MADEPDLGLLTRQAADYLATRQMGVVVAALRGPQIEICGAGRTGQAGGGVPEPNTLFEIGSVTKVFTALTLARLVTAGVVDLDEPLTRSLPRGARVPERGEQQITLGHLATHTSGLPRVPAGVLRRAMFGSTRADPYAGCTAESILAGLARTRLRSVPGQRFRYSNLGGGLLGLALAHRAGNRLDDDAYDALVTEQVCGPLKLPDTRVVLTREQTERTAQGHLRSGRATPAWTLRALAGAGGLCSTAVDLAALVRAYLGPAPEELGEAIGLTRQVRHPIDRRSWVQLGWMGVRLPHPSGPVTQIWHNGGTGGFRSWVGMIPDRQSAVIVLSNAARSVDGPASDLLRVATFGGRMRYR